MNMTIKKIASWLADRKILLAIIILSFIFSIIYSWHFRIKPAVDARAYDVIAQNIVSGVGFREEPQKDILHDFAIARVGPLYQYFLAGIYKFFGHYYELVWVFQALLRALSVWLVYLTARQIFESHENSKKIALIAAAFFGFYPDLIEISAMLLIETLYLFLFCLMLYIFFRFLNRSGNFLAALLGLVGGLAILARPPVLFLIPVVLFYFWRQKLWRQALLFLVVLILVFTPWTIRNYLTYGKIMPFGAAGSYNFWIGNWHGGDGEQSPQPFHYAFTATHEIKEINGESIRQFKLFLREYPVEFLKLTALRINKYFSVIRPMGFWFYQTGIGQLLFILFSAIASVFLFVFGLAGAIKAWRAKDKKLNYLLALTIFTPLIIFVTVVETRYRFQIYPLLAIFAGYFIAGLSANQRWRADKIFWLASGLVLGNGLLDLFLSANKFLERLNKFL